LAHLSLPILLRSGAHFSLAWSQVVAMTTHPKSRHLTRAFPGHARAGGSFQTLRPIAGNEVRRFQTELTTPFLAIDHHWLLKLGLHH